MSTLILHHDDCARHDPGPWHAESPARIKAVIGAVESLPGTEVLPAPRATEQQLELAHVPDYWKRLLELEPQRKDPHSRIALDADTFLSSGSINATLRGSGAACFAVDQVLARKSRNAFCAARPPGHHANSDTAMGFCLLNHAAVAARYAQQKHAVGRIAILDFDVHHGNGTQDIFEDSPEVLFISSHQIPLYPGTGHPEETGRGNILNLPLPPGSGSAEFRTIWSDHGLRALEKFSPELIIISAGFDAHVDDPMAHLELGDDDYGWITTEIRAMAEALCDGRVISVLEGGYDLDALASSSAAHVKALAG